MRAVGRFIIVKQLKEESTSGSGIIVETTKTNMPVGIVESVGEFCEINIGVGETIYFTNIVYSKRDPDGGQLLVVDPKDVFGVK